VREAFHHIVPPPAVSKVKVGLVVRPKRLEDRFRGGNTRAALVGYEGEGFYLVRIGSSAPIIVHEDDIELVDKEKDGP
jgi:hypothetical protein